MKILITGATGLLGKKAYNTLLKNHEVYGTYNSQNVERLHKLDINKYGAVKNLIEEIKPDLVVHTAALTDVDLSDKNYELAWKTNATGCFNIAHICNLNNAKLIYISTDYVFSGKNSPYKEDDIPHPLSFYGKSKLIGEKAILKIFPNNVVIRVPILYGYNDKNDKKTFVSDVIEKLKTNQEVIIIDNRIKYPLLIDDVIENIILLYKKNVSGIFHFSSKNKITKYEWALKIAEVFGLNKDLIKKGNPKSFSNRPFNVELINTNEPELRFHGIEDGLQIVKKQMEEKL